MCNLVDCTHMYLCIHYIKKEESIDNNNNNNMKVCPDILRREFEIFVILHFGCNILNLENFEIFNSNLDSVMHKG